MRYYGQKFIFLILPLCFSLILGTLTINIVSAQQGADTADPGYVPPKNTTGAPASGATGSWATDDAIGKDGSESIGKDGSESIGKDGPRSKDSGLGSKSLINPIACSPAAQVQGRCFVELLMEIISIILVFAVPIIVLYIMYAGYLFVTAAGNSEKVSDARNALLWSIIGGVIILGAKIIVEIIEGTVAGLK